MNGLLEHVVDGHGFAHRSVVKLLLCPPATAVLPCSCSAKSAFAKADSLVPVGPVEPPAHSYDPLQKCPICRRPARDMIQHLLHHAQSPSQTTSSQPGTPLTSRSAKVPLQSVLKAAILSSSVAPSAGLL